MPTVVSRSLFGLLIAVLLAACPAATSSVEDAAQKAQEEFRQQPVAKVTSVKKKGEIVLTWEAHPLAQKYELQRAITPNVAQARDLIKAGAYHKLSETWETIATITGTEYTDTLDVAGTYQYRVRAVFDDGNVSPWAMVAEISVANEDLVAPETAPVAPTNLAGTSPSSARVELTWKDNADNETGFRVERKTGAEGTYVKVADVAKDAQSFADTGLTPSTLYVYRVFAVNAVGDSAASNEAQATTPEAPPVVNPPAAPTGLNAVAVESASVQIAWTDNATDETGYKVMRKLGTNGTYIAVATLAANAQGYTDTSVAPLTQYFYKVIAYNTGGNSTASNAIEVNTPTDVVAPSAPTWSSSTALSAAQIAVAWTDNANNEDGYKVERKLGVGGTYVVIATLGANVTNYEDSGLAASTQYFYRVYAYNTGGNSAYTESNATTEAETPGEVAPPAPSMLTTTTISSSRIDLAWIDNANNETGFKVERRTAGGSFSVIATLGAGVVSYSDMGLDAATQYYYRVYAYNGAGNSVTSNEDSATTDAPSQTAPAAPTNLDTYVLSAGAISVYWQDNSSDETGFRVFRATGAGAFGLIAELAADETSFNDSGLVGSTTYRYQVKAFNGAGESASSQVTATTNSADCTETWTSATYIGAGTDANWGTSDDQVGSYHESRYDGYGNWVYSTHRNYDQTGTLLDGNVTKRSYNLAGLITTEEVYNGPGVDETWDTSDDILAERRTYTYNQAGQTIEDTTAYYEGGVFTYGSRFVYAQTATETVLAETWEYDQPGADNVFGTSDDRLYRYSSDFFGSGRNASTEIIYVGDEWNPAYGHRNVNEFDSTHSQMTHSSAGSDLVFGTSDDVDLERSTSYLVNGVASHTVESVPGPDNKFDTEDDATSGYIKYTYTNGKLTREAKSADSGVDAIWGTEDDALSRVHSYLYDAAGNEIRSELFEYDTGVVMWAELRLAQYDAYGNETSSYTSSSPGADGIFLTADDGNYSKTMSTYNGETLLESRTEDKTDGTLSYTRRVYSTAEATLGSYDYYSDRGPDATWGTADDVLDEWYETNSSPTEYSTASYTGMGLDGVRGTSDDVFAYKHGSTYDSNGYELKSWWLYNWEGTIDGSVTEYVRDEFGMPVGEKTMGPGPDGVYLTVDDVVVEYHHHEYDLNGNLLYEQISTAAGGDGIWGTADDTITGREVEGYESACNP